MTVGTVTAGLLPMYEHTFILIGRIVGEKKSFKYDLRQMSLKKIFYINEFYPVLRQQSQKMCWVKALNYIMLYPKLILFFSLSSCFLLRLGYGVCLDGGNRQSRNYQLQQLLPARHDFGLLIE